MPDIAEVDFAPTDGIAPVDRAEIMKRVLSVYIGHKRDQLLEAEIDRLIESCEMSKAIGPEHSSRVGRLAEGRILAVMGKPGAGKTRALERVFRKREEFWGSSHGQENSHLISVKAPSPCTLRQLGNTLLQALGYDVQRELRENVVWDMVRHRLQVRGVRYVHIDEIQHAVEKANRNELQKVRDTLKALLQQPEWPVWLILSGKPSFASFIEDDTQLKRRSRFVSFGDLSLADDAKLIRNTLSWIVEKRAELELATASLGEPFFARLVHAAEGQFGILVEFVQDAIHEALIERCATVKLEHFAKVYEARSGCSRDRNVFTADQWHLIDVSMALQDNQVDDHQVEDIQSEKKVRDKKNK
ncbi:MULTISPECIES: ATP-binding protein [unclassified Mesorhizobium]|uniref:ATP-binding protein n=1 Tax=unclassified Mesorhizobium TaxID=325217 RepID=UPI00301C5231